MANGIARKGFDLDLADGTFMEGVLASHLRKTGTEVEVKADFACGRTGHLYLEYNYRDKPSGILTTTATFWAFCYDGGSWLIIPTTKLRLLYKRALKESLISRGGDRDYSRGVLIPIEWFVKAGAEVGRKLL